MPDDRNFFDDDSLPPDWEQDFIPDAEDAPSEDAPATRPPWETQTGSRPPEPQDIAPTPAPWDLHPGEAEPAPEPPRAAPPWSAAPRDESLDDLRQQASRWETWDTAEPASPPPAGAAPFDTGADDLAWMRDFGTAGDAEMPVPAEDDDLAWLGQVQPGQEPPVGDEPAPPRKIDTDELPWLDDETFTRIPSIEPDDEFTLSPGDPAAAQLEQAREDAFWPVDDSFPAEEAPAEPAESIPDWLSAPLDASAPQAAGDEPSAAPPETPGHIPGVTRRLRLPEDLPPAQEDAAPDWLSDADHALDAVEAGQPQALTFDEWERQQEEREREARKSPEERLLESVPDWFDQLGDAPDTPAAPPSEPPAEKSAEPDFMPGWFLGLEEQKTEDAPDWFQQLDFSGDPLAAPPEPPAHEPAPAEDDVPDWFKGVAAPGEAEASDFSLFADEPAQAGSAGGSFGDWSAGDIAADAEDDDDFVERFDPLGAEIPGAADAAASVPDWLRELEEAEPPAPAAWTARPALPTEEARADDVPDWLDDLSPDDLAASESLEALFAAEADAGLTPAPPAPETPALAGNELEQLLESIEAPLPVPTHLDEAGAWPDEETFTAALDQALPGDAETDLDSFFPEVGPGQPVPGLERLFSEEASPGEQPPDVAKAEQPDWIADLRPADLPVTVHAAGIEVDVPQTPVVQLPPRVHAFREKTLRELGEPSAPQPVPEAGALAGLTGALGRFDAALPVVEPSAPLSGVVVTREQQARVKKLQALLAAAEEPEEAPAAEEAPDAQVTARRARRPRRFKPDRVLITLLMLAALIAPFASDVLHFADDPPPLGAAGQEVAAAFDALAPGAYVLVAFEYGPTAAGELDPLVEAALRDAFTRGAVPLAISTNTAGALHAEAVFGPLAADAALLSARAGEGEPVALVAGVDYALLGYLPGDALGIRTLTETYGAAGAVHPAFATDLRGEATNLPIHVVADDLALIVVAGEDTDDVRAWAEQLKGLAVPKVALVSAALEPLIDPYLYEGGYAGYLSGVRDTYSYNLERNASARSVYTLPDGLDFDIPNPEDARWHSMALGAAAAAGLIALGMVFNLLRALVRRRP